MPGANKASCFQNFLQIFESVIFTDDVFNKGEKPCLTIIADRVDNQATLKMLKETGLPVVSTDLGNAGSLIFTIKTAIEENQDQDLIYFCEDDYIHRPFAPQLLEEGIQFGDYVTLYDHPDKYTSVYNFGEISKVMKGQYIHWRHTASTCMTFGSKVETLKKDLETWVLYTNGSHPHDHTIFTELTKLYDRKVVVAIPGHACHTDLTFSGQSNQVLMEDWAILEMCRQIEIGLNDELKDLRCALVKDDMKSWDKLKMLDALSNMK